MSPIEAFVRAQVGDGPARSAAADATLALVIYGALSLAALADIVACWWHVW